MLSPEQWMREYINEAHGYREAGGWKYACEKPVQPWKIHVYAETFEDWMKVAQVILPYLQGAGMTHKTVADGDILEKLTKDPWQKGKSFTVYTQSAQGLKQVILDLDGLLLQAKHTRLDKVFDILGDRPIGRSGRIFYRYDCDIFGHYRPNDGDYKPAELRDPFLSFEIERAIAQLAPQETLFLKTPSGERVASLQARHSGMHAPKTFHLCPLEGAIRSTEAQLFLNGQAVSSTIQARPGDTIWMMPDVEIFLLNT